MYNIYVLVSSTECVDTYIHVLCVYCRPPILFQVPIYTLAISRERHDSKECFFNSKYEVFMYLKIATNATYPKRP